MLLLYLILVHNRVEDCSTVLNPCYRVACERIEGILENVFLKIKDEEEEDNRLKTTKG